jgi:hypothetical protein
VHFLMAAAAFPPLSFFCFDLPIGYLDSSSPNTANTRNGNSLSINLYLSFDANANCAVFNVQCYHYILNFSSAIVLIFYVFL